MINANQVQPLIPENSPSPSGVTVEESGEGKRIDIQEVARQFRYEHFWALRNITGPGFQHLIENLLAQVLSEHSNAAGALPLSETPVSVAPSKSEGQESGDTGESLGGKEA